MTDLNPRADHMEMDGLTLIKCPNGKAFLRVPHTLKDEPGSALDGIVNLLGGEENMVGVMDREPWMTGDWILFDTDENWWADPGNRSAASTLAELDLAGLAVD